MRSDWRGVARGTQPKRSTSARGPPVCISSMAQQARPNSMYHCEDFLPQLRRSSTLVVKTVSGKELSRGCIDYLLTSGRSAFNFLHPLKISFCPDVNQAEE